MRKNVIPFPPRKAVSSPPVQRIEIHVGARRYALEIPCEATVLPPEPAPMPTPNPVEHRQVQTRLLVSRVGRNGP